MVQKNQNTDKANKTGQQSLGQLGSTQNKQAPKTNQTPPASDAAKSEEAKAAETKTETPKTETPKAETAKTETPSTTTTTDTDTKEDVQSLIDAAKYVLRDINLYKKSGGKHGLYLVSEKEIPGHKTVKQLYANNLAKIKRKFVIYEVGKEPSLVAQAAKAENKELASKIQAKDDEIAKLKAELAKQSVERARG